MSPENKRFLRETFYDPYFSGVDKIQKDGWLTPDGRFFSCESDEHNQCAEFLLKDERGLKGWLMREKGIRRRDLNKLSARSLLTQAGYILVNHSVPNFWDVPRPTLAQMAILENSDIPIPKEIDERVYGEDFSVLVSWLKTVPVPEKLKAALEEFLNTPVKGLRFYNFEEGAGLAYALYELLSPFLHNGKSMVQRKRSGDSHFMYKFFSSGNLALAFKSHLHDDGGIIEETLSVFSPEDVVSVEERLVSWGFREVRN